MADTEEYFHLNKYIFGFLAIVALFSLSEANIINGAFSRNKFVVEIDAQSLPVYNRHKLSLENNDVSANVHQLHKRDTQSNDAKCKGQAGNLADKSAQLVKTHTFDNETKTAMALAWAGQNDGTLIIVTTEDLMGTTQESSVFRSTDYGVHYSNITDSIGLRPGDYVIKKHSGLQRHPIDTQRVYLIGEGKYLYTTTDGGLTFIKRDLSFVINGELIFHPNKHDYLIALDAYKDMFVSKDNGASWKKVDIQDQETHETRVVDKVVWGVLPDADQGNVLNPDTADTIYFTYGVTQINDPFLKQFFDFGFTNEYTLAKSTDGGLTYTILLEKVVSFERQGKFLYVSQVKDNTDANGWRHLLISTDGGQQFKEVQLPTIEPDRFFSVMDIEDNMIFMHVDNKLDSGHGTLYTSANQGIVYSISLTKHFFPNYGETHDFYKVNSMRGVYFTSQMRDDDSIHTMITFNRGADWQAIPRPDGVPCKDESKECSLQLHGMYSLKRGINATTPQSEKTAIGLILAHGHVADALQKTDPDVFVSRDGGYTWNLALKGPHHYQIGDHGGLLVAVSMSELNPNIIKFSVDEGRCWHEYKYTDKVLNFTGLLTEPEGKSSVVMLWGYVADTKKWEVNVIDFKNIINRKCGDADYEPWKAHETQRKTEDAEMVGCMLGIKETFLRLKPDSWCYNGYDHKVENKSEKCTCTREDYECDYGYFRPGGSEECVKQNNFQGPDVDICLHGHDEKIVSLGYRKIPGDKCANGFQPSSKRIDLNKVCDEFGKQIVEIDEGKPTVKSKSTSAFGRGIKVIAVIVVIAVLALASVMGVYFIRKFILLNRHKTGYRYSLLNQGEQANLMGDDDDDEEAGNLERDLDKALSSTVKYEDSDEELNTTARPSSSSRQNGGVKKASKPKPKDTNPFGSFHDDSDDDMLS